MGGMTNLRLAAAAVLLVVPAGCGGGSEGDRAASTSTTAATGPAAAGDGPARVIDVSDAGVEPHVAMSDGLSLWLAGAAVPEGGRVVRVDLTTSQVSWTADVPDAVVGLALDQRSDLWAVGGGEGADPTGGISRLNSQTGQVFGTLESTDGSPYGVAATADSVWVTDARSDRVWRVDPSRGGIAATVRVAQHPRAIAFDGDEVWVASPDAGVVTRLDAATGAERGTVTVPSANSVVANRSAVWVGGQDVLARFDPSTGERVGEIPVDGVAVAQAMSPGWVWAQRPQGALFRGDADGLRVDPRAVGVPGAVVAVDTDYAYVYEPGGRRVVQWTLPLPSDLDFPAEQPRDGSNFGYVGGVDGDTVMFDPAEELTGPPATEAARVDGFNVTAEEGVPGGLYDRNRDGKTHPLRLASDARLELLGFDSNGRPSPQAVDREAFRRALTDPRQAAAFYGLPGLVPFRVTIADGAVVAIEQVYRP